MRLQVRCCCDPNKILGDMAVPDFVGKGGTFRVLLQVPEPFLKRSWNANHCAATEVLDLEVAPFTYGMGMFYAIKSNDLPIETFRRIPSFVEYK